MRIGRKGSNWHGNDIHLHSDSHSYLWDTVSVQHVQSDRSEIWCGQWL